MRALQTIAFLALVVSAGGIENQNGELQPAAIGIMIVSLVVLLITARHENAPACGNRRRSKKDFRYPGQSGVLSGAWGYIRKNRIGC